MLIQNIYRLNSTIDRSTTHCQNRAAAKVASRFKGAVRAKRRERRGRSGADHGKERHKRSGRIGIRSAFGPQLAAKAVRFTARRAAIWIPGASLDI